MKRISDVGLIINGFRGKSDPHITPCTDGVIASKINPTGVFSQSDALKPGYFALLNSNLRDVAVPLLGKSLGISWVTLPLAAHSVPRKKVTMNPIPSNASVSWPRVVWKTRPLW